MSEVKTISATTMMTAIPLTRKEAIRVADLLLFNSIVLDESESVINIIERFNIPPDHKILGLCEPMSYISKNFLEISTLKNARMPTLNAISVLEEEMVKTFCMEGIHALELAIKVDAIITFHALLDIGHRDIESKVVHLAVKCIKPDMLSRLAEDGFDLWGVHSDWMSRPIDILYAMVRFRDDIPSIFKESDSIEKLTECLKIIIENKRGMKDILYPCYEVGNNKPTSYNGGRLIRKRDFGIPEMDIIMCAIAHGFCY